MTTPDSKNPSDVLDTIERQLAVEAAENGKPTAGDREWSRKLGGEIQLRLAELRRQHTPVDVPIQQAKPIRSSTLAMTRDALLDAISRLTRSMNGNVQYAHRNLKGLSDDDLRRMYDTMDPDADSHE
jgi:hypothetical protein